MTLEKLLYCTTYNTKKKCKLSKSKDKTKHIKFYQQHTAGLFWTWFTSLKNSTEEIWAAVNNSEGNNEE
jgi:hypothetical protein